MTTPALGRPATRADLDAMPDDGRRYELVEGEIVVSAAPAPRHQYISVSLVVLLKTHCPRDLHLYHAPFDVELEKDFSVLEPDLVVVDPALLDHRGLVGAPLLAIEILSPTTRRRDLRQKKAIYERTGVPSYWVVDPDGDVSLTVWELREGRYQAVAAISGDEEWTASAPFEVTVIPSRLVP
ncbi:Uma2 family endonuclease [Nocardioides humi]|nr:Uma2 family endonuclease [Nocardioides humi]